MPLLTIRSLTPPGGVLLADSDPGLVILAICALPFLFTLGIVYLKARYGVAEATRAAENAARELRGEMERLRAETNEIIVSYDRTVASMERRIAILESAQQRSDVSART